MTLLRIVCAPVKRIQAKCALLGALAMCEMDYRKTARSSKV
jgi:hypothetical protein